MYMVGPDGNTWTIKKIKKKKWKMRIKAQKLNIQHHVDWGQTPTLTPLPLPTWVNLMKMEIIMQICRERMK